MFRTFYLTLLCVVFAVPAAVSAAPVVDRSEFTTTRQLPDGKLSTAVSPQPLNFQTESGAWKPVDLALEAAGNGAVSPAAVDGDIVIPDGLSSPIVVEHDGREASIRLKGASGDAEVDDATAVFDDALPGVDVQYEATASGVKERLVLASAEAPVVFAYDVRAGEAWSAAVDSLNQVVLRDGGGVERYRLTAPLAWDSAEDPSFTNDLRLAVSKVSDGRWTVTLRPDLAWLRDPARVFPVTLDPDFSWSNGTTTFNGATDTYLASGDKANSVFSASSYLQTGHFNRTYRTLVRFNVAAAIPSNAVVSGSTFKAYAPPATPKSLASHSLRTVTAEWDANANWNRRKVGVPWTTLGGEVSSNSAYTSASTNVQTNPGWYSWTAPVATVQGWVAGTLPNYGFQLTTDSGAPSGNAYVWASTEASMSSDFPADATKRPILEVTWSVPDTTAPALTLAGALSSNQSTWRTAATGDITLSATDAGTGVKRLEVLEGSTVIAGDTQTCPAGACSQSKTFTLDLDALGEGVHTLKAAAVDGGNLRTEQTFSVRVDRAAPGLALTGTLVDDESEPAQSGSRSVHVVATDAGAGIVDLELKVDGVQREHVTQTCAAGGCSRTEDWTVDIGALGDGPHTVQINATDGAGRTKTEALEIVKEAYPMPDAPELSDTSVTPFDEQVDFLWTGPDAVQTGVAPGAIDRDRVAVITGKVFNGEGQPAGGVKVSVVDHPEYGHATSRDTGDFFLGVSGGGQFRLRYEVQGALPAEREVDTQWNDYTEAEDVWLVTQDPAGTQVDFGVAATTPQLAEASTISDSDGTRTARVYVRPGTQAWKQMDDGQLQPLVGGTVRVTEYTVGDSGPERMPASLPDATAYTWAAEYQVDEASGQGVDHVLFSKPVVSYLDNFLGSPVGMEIPVGTYEPSTGKWEGDPDGRVIEILDEVAGKAVIDVTGFGAANAQELSHYNIDDDELEMLADTYQPGKKLWRTEMARFSTKDLNKPRWIPRRKKRDRDPKEDEQDDDCQKSGSIIGCFNQSLGEVADLGGTPYSLRYDSARTPGAIAARGIRVPLTDSTVDSDLVAVTATVLIAGQKLTYTDNDPQPNDTHTFRWDGKDKFGREMAGGAVADVITTQSFEDPYSAPGMGGPLITAPGAGGNDDDFFWVVAPYYEGGRSISWGLPGSQLAMAGVLSMLKPADQPVGRPNLECDATETTCWYPVDEDTDERPYPMQRQTTNVEDRSRIDVPYYDPRGLGTGGWTVSAHHRYDTATGTLYTGDGQRRSASATGDIIETVRPYRRESDGDLADANHGDLAVLPDGSILRAEYHEDRIVRDWPDGHTTLFAGDVSAPGNTGDGGPALNAGIDGPDAIAVGPDGSVYIAEWLSHVIRKIDPSGIITRVAGNGTYTPTGDGRSGPSGATWYPSDLATTADGTLYIASRSGLHRLDPSGALTKIASQDAECGTKGNSCLFRTWGYTIDQLAATPGGDLYFSTVASTGNVRTVYHWQAGADTPTLLSSATTFAEEIVEGPIASSNVWPLSMAVDAQDRLWLADFHESKRSVWRLGADNRITRIGLKQCDNPLSSTAGIYAGEGGPFSQACGETHDMARGPDGMYVQEDYWDGGLVRRVRPAISRYPAGESLIPSEDGSEAYRFDAEGRHLATIDGRTERVLRTFSYDTAGRLSAITETDFGTTTFAYDAAGDVTVTGPDGQTTTLDIGAGGYLAKVTDAAGESEQYAYGSSGLMTRYENQLGKASTFTWGPTGRLLTDTSPGGGVQTLSRSEQPTSSTVSHTTAGGQTSTYARERGDVGEGDERTVTSASGATNTAKADATQSSTTTELADGTQIAQKVDGDGRWIGTTANAETTMKLPSGATATAATKTTVQRGATQNSRDPFDYESIIDTYTVNGRTTTSTYDKAERTDTSASPMGRESQVEYDEDDRAVRVTSADREDVEIEYDSRGRPISTKQGTAESSVTYGADGRVAASTDAENRTTSYVRDNMGRTTSMTRPGSVVTLFGYDAASQLTQITAPDSRTFNYEYDDNGNQTKLTRNARPGSSNPALVYEREYDDQDRLTSRTRPSGEEVTTTYDAAGRIDEREAADGTSSSATYEPVTSGKGGRLQSMQTGDGAATSFEYDGSLLTGVQTLGDTWTGDATADQPQVTFGYDNSMRVTRETIDGDDVAVTYNADDQPTQIGDVSIAYDAQSGDPQTASAGKSTTSYDLDTRGNLAAHASTVEMPGVAAPVFSESVVRDELGRITQRTETVGAAAPTTFGYQYDPAGRLTQVTQGGLTTETYGYDASDGLVGRGDGVLSSWIDTDGHGRPVELADGTELQWSPDGELVKTTSSGGAETVFGYDGFGRLVEVTLPDGRVGRYRYDALGRRSAVRIDGAMIRRYDYGAADFPRARLDAGGDVLERYVYASADHVPDLIVRRDGQRLRLITDALGSVRAVVDIDSGQVVQRLAYDAYGRVTQDTAPGTQPFGFKGSLSDPLAEGAGLVWMGVRAYLPSIARFSTVDPAGLAAGWNQHDALGGDPINMIDADGRLPVLVPVAVFAGRVMASWAIRKLASSAAAKAAAGLAAEWAYWEALDRLFCVPGPDATGAGGAAGAGSGGSDDDRPRIKGPRIYDPGPTVASQKDVKEEHLRQQKEWEKRRIAKEASNAKERRPRNKRQALTELGHDAIKIITKWVGGDGGSGG